ncbi:dmso reductase anchor subunit [Salmonella enterica subsp. enterica serovar Typhimurium str. DT104]|nr:dmso reductase anchor subunit [Salmonella enterica subsp. enterica serovar Typhimurium str. DT104]
MGSGWHEWPLMIFTVFGQCVVGALIVSGLGWLTAKDDTIARQRIVRSMFFLWLVMGLGFLASIMHLGSPMRAFNSLNRVGASALSNEIAAGSVFFAVGGIWWLVAVLGKMPPALGKVWLLVSMALGVAFIWAMTLVYQIDTVPTWYNGYTTLAFFLTAFLCGPVFAALLLRIARVPFCSVTFASISGLALVVCVTVIVLQGLSLSTIHSSVQQAGCRYCHMACPYGAPQYNAAKGHMTKCDGCYDRVAEGKKPICVESCPLRALDFGPIDELRKKHGELAAVAPLPRAHFTKPNIVIKPNANSRPTGDTTGYLANPKEV